ncbi:hypothetical protein G7Y41_08735 [Schaalia sp. ZJ405]|uniref:hypothetical protein n=1 Tax=Schaalia sp. ZJ405 TaxID=2709403 RepID=UPI0013ECDFC1|nr:hypothetical protein [Schaalia sp. ZJ405]QPK81110.1 hypothetical protein G7Y41_08735 [Schaalia sp. ZJ405]
MELDAQDIMAAYDAHLSKLTRDLMLARATITALQARVSDLENTQATTDREAE